MRTPTRLACLLAAVFTAAGCAVAEQPVPDVPAAIDASDARADARMDAPVAEAHDTFVPPIDVPRPDAADAFDAPPDVAPDAAPEDAAPDAPPDTACRMMCGTSCVDTLNDVRNCGTCFRDCTALLGIDPRLARCSMGQCVVEGTCLPGRADCNRAVDDGCEADLTTAARCGSCTTTCAEPTPNCGMVAGDGGGSGYACTSGCVAPTPARCGTQCVDLDTNTRHCGACNTVCPAGLNSIATCAMGRCGLACSPGYGNCDGNATNGCETLLASNVANCGMCGNACPAAANGAPTCSASTCGFVCNAGFGNCDAMAANGCETDLRGNVMHCGACGRACTAPANATATCPTTACSFTCLPNFGNCDLSTLNGCEADLRSNALHCGACNRRCAAAANATATCAMGACGLACNAGFANCDGDGLNGCEVALATNPAHCGACGTACPGAPNAAGSCSAGACGLACNAGFGNCDGVAANGCEADLRTSMAHCGACGMACNPPANATAMCASSRCVVTCNPGFFLNGATCERTPPQKVSPSSTGVVTSRQPTFRVVLPPGQDGAFVEVCADRGCTSVATSFAFAGAAGAPSVMLAPGVYYWRATGRAGGVSVTAPSGVWEFTVATTRTPLGVSASWGTVYDVNGDRFADVLVGAPSSNRAALYLGGTSGLISTLVQAYFTGSTSTGTGVGSAGDVNGDGYADTIVGAPTANLAYVYHGGPTVSTVVVATLTAPAATVSFGSAVASAGDVNGDGFSGVLVGAPSSNRVVHYRGSATGLVTASPVIIDRPAGASNFGVSVAGACDLDADGFHDVVVGTDGSNTAYIYRGSAAGLVLAAPIVIAGPAGSSGFGRSVACAGDVNGDGYPDLVVGAYGSLAAYVYHGGAAGPDAVPDATLRTTTDGLQFGFAVSDAGDANGDGYADVIVGAPGSARAYVFHGGAAGVAATASTTLVGSAGSRFGAAVASVSVVHATSRFADVVVGAPSISAATFFRGGVSGIATTGTALSSAGVGAGTSVASAWDVILERLSERAGRRAARLPGEARRGS